MFSSEPFQTYRGLNHQHVFTLSQPTKRHWPLFNTKGSSVQLPCGIWGTRSFGLHKADTFHGHTERSCSSGGPNRQDTWSGKDFDKLHSQW